ncbi:MAG: hypothetical protein GFH27_549313n85 [Chloroflexi bacterium AL-W]|nr:hypothetical protein [Chloroflexi bacterium AL-N1]NOK69508.1 hypothetical protein [Chloroflexi bacterium AL-N10]NOK77473.1 hypothetical protein [Chloroflexi bacterium AL-N5]NOK84324.1 hypothetical protein [Chloroflexi bacterium AL-W]NOK91510.1 hypothetical protein [Chloroflexi bacterium AL-N15]
MYTCIRQLGRSISVAICIASLCILTTVVHGQKDTTDEDNVLSSDTAVFAAVDNTTQAGCVVSVDRGPEKSCPPGSVTEVWQTTYAEVQSRDISTFAKVSGDLAQDQHIRDQIAEKLNAQIQQVPSAFTPMAGCVAHNDKLIEGRYRFTDGPSVSYEMTYDFDNQCNVFDIKDRTSDDGSGVRWSQSCTDGQSRNNKQCNHINIKLNGAWTSWHNQQNSFAGKQYRNISEYGFRGVYGWWKFD